MPIRCDIEIDGEKIGVLEMKLESKMDMGKLVKVISKDIVGEAFRRIMLFEDFTRSVLSSDTGSILSLSDGAMVEDVLNWFGRFYVVFLFQRTRVEFVFSKGDFEEKKPQNLEEIFLNSGSYMGYEILPVRYDDALAFSRGDKTLSEMLKIKPIEMVRFEKKLVSSDTTVGELMEGVMEIRTSVGKRPLCVVSFPYPAFEKILSKMRLGEICSLGEKFEIETFSDVYVGSCISNI